jgi:hypothetical protein
LQKNQQPVAEAEVMMAQVAPRMKKIQMKMQNQKRAAEAVNF